jgi:hypothetical protein
MSPRSAALPVPSTINPLAILIMLASLLSAILYHIPRIGESPIRKPFAKATPGKPETDM